MNSIVFNTPIGYIKIAEEKGEITEITYRKFFEEGTGECTSVLSEAKKQMEEYFDGERKEFSLPLRITGTEFNKAVLNKLSKVPYGSTVTYGQLAQLCGHPKAARAVGSAMRKNPFVIVIPCHRVLQHGNKMGNYSAGGPANKEWLLTFEKQNSGKILF